MQEPNDKDLVTRCLAGDLKAFEILLERYQKPVFNIALRVLSNTDDAADVTQTTFVKAYEKLYSYDNRYKFFSWLYKIAVNTSFNLLEQKKRSDLLGDREVPDGNRLEEELHAAERVEKLEDAILNLPVEYRVVIVLRHFHDLSYEEMGIILDLPERTVKSRLFTARQMLRDLLINSGLMEQG
jgi:RNA polymerase sigma-70 factor (ECF subfamily)